MFLVSRYIKYILRVTIMTPVNYVRSSAVAKACSKALKSCQCLGGNKGILDCGKVPNHWPEAVRSLQRTWGMSDHGKVPDQRSENSETPERILHHKSSGEGIRSAFWTFPPCCHGHIVSPLYLSFRPPSGTLFLSIRHPRYRLWALCLKPYYLIHSRKPAILLSPRTHDPTKTNKSPK